jgi:photosynthetic reaction center cytochrome c subunit
MNSRRNTGSRFKIVWAIFSAVSSCFLLAGVLWGQATRQTSETKVEMSEEAFKNVQVLRGIPVDEFMQTMGFFAAATGMNCTTCHTVASGSNWANYGDDTPLKQQTRQMMVMVNALNRTSFGGRRVVTCWTCHRGVRNPSVTPSLAVQYSNSLEEEPDEVIPETSGPSPNEILNKFLDAIGGPSRVASITSLVGKGTYQGFDTAFAKIPFDLFAKSPDQRTTVVHTLEGDYSTVYNGRLGWLASPPSMRPITLIPLTGGDLDGVKLDAKISFPFQIKDMLVDLHLGVSETIGDRDVQVLQGRLVAGGLPVKLYFDSMNGLLVRMVRYSSSPVGNNPTQIDYSDYRDVSGIKIPFRWVATWTDNRQTFELTELHANASVEPARFERPVPPLTPKAQSR